MTRKFPNHVKLSYFITIILIIIFLNSCDQVRKRPVGWIRLGPVKNFLADETYLSDERLMIRRDQAGFSAMSTMCSYDLSALRRVVTGDTYIWVSNFSDSKYTATGEVLEGPATAPLPYYYLRIDALVHGAPKDTLYVQIGIERDKSWRLPFGTPPAPAPGSDSVDELSEVEEPAPGSTEVEG